MISCIRNTSEHDDFKGMVRLLDQDLNQRYGELQASYDEYLERSGDSFGCCCHSFRILV